MKTNYIPIPSKNSKIKHHWLTKPVCGTQIDWTNPITKGLVGCWLFNEGSGLRINDLSGNNNHGTLTGFEPFSATSGWTGGKTGTALNFNGGSNSVNNGTLTNDVGNGTNNFSISAWIKSNDVTQLKAIAGKVKFNLNEWGIYQNNSLLYFQIRGAALASSVSTSTISNNKWYFVVGVRKENMISIYLDGNIINTLVTIVSPNTLSDNFYVGRRVLNNDFNFKGIIEEVAIWSRALSDNEIKSIYSEPYAMFKY